MACWKKSGEITEAEDEDPETGWLPAEVEGRGPPVAAARAAASCVAVTSCAPPCGIQSVVLSLQG